MVVCFTAAELQKLAEDLGVSGGVGLYRGVEEAAREVIRQCERYAGLDALVAKLRAERPLVEWPEPPATPGPVPVEVPPPAVEPESAAVPSREDAPPEVAAPPPSPSSSPPPPVPPPSTRAVAWPGIAEPAQQKPPPRGIDQRILLAVAGLTLLAAIIAFFAGRASSKPGTAATADASPHPKRTTGPAVEASDVFAKSIASLARVCEVQVGDAEDVFKRVAAKCGPPPRQPTHALPAEAFEPAADDPPTPRDPRPPRPIAPPKPPANGCLSSCESTHQGCRSRCGPEPTEGSKYGDYNQCQARCLSAASKCRLTCN